MLVGLDSTDSRSGGCTTHVALELWRRVSEFDVRIAPRLVRLNPNVPFKTRGNGALCLELGHAKGPRARVGRYQGVDLFASQEIEEPFLEEQLRIQRVAREVITEFRAHGSNSGLAVLSAPPPRSFYDACVQRLVDPQEAAALLADAASVQTWGDGRGLVGALAAAAWPAERGSWELVWYRRRERWGSRREFASGTGAELDRLAPHTFDNYDAKHRYLRIAPHSPCPILAGVRGSDFAELVALAERPQTEDPAGWCVFMTNQASGDHLVVKPIAALRPFDGATVRAIVAAAPETRAGGHVFVRLRDDSGEIVASAFEPTKEFRQFVRSWHEGDEVLVEGGVPADGKGLNLEAAELCSRAPVLDLTAPGCVCGATMQSVGRRGGYRCVDCGRRSAEASGRSWPDPAPSPTGRITVPIAVRRHLSRPNGIPVGGFPFVLSEGRS